MLFKTNPLKRLMKQYAKMLEVHGKTVEQIGNLQDMQKWWLFFISAQFDLHSFKELYEQYFIPSAEKSVVNMRSAIKDSKMKKLKFFDEEFIDSNYQLTLQQGYIMLFHKYEHFSKSIIKILYNVSSEKEVKKVLSNLVKQYDFPDHKGDDRSENLKEVQWINNSAKHHAGCAFEENKADIPIKYIGLKPTEKIKLSKKELLHHIDFMLQYQAKVVEVLISINAMESLQDTLKSKGLKKEVIETLECMRLIFESKAQNGVIALKEM